VLFDEFEKADRAVSNLFLQILDEGFLTDSQGRKVDFRNTIVIMTSNLGADILAQLPPGEPSISAKAEVLGLLQRTFAPEFLNRIDETILFNRLTMKDLDLIINVQMKAVEKILSEKRISIKIDHESKKFLVDHGFDEVYGARPLKRAIQSYLFNPLSRLILDGQLLEGQSVKVKLNKKANLEVDETPFEFVTETPVPLTKTK
jgi:ATP-dependent Clp protease ATP-binding subunit ClpB